ncbi:hypothetical protein R5R35_006599 [Gryllus longicercus]|uniref:Acidic fibroblast growth factor intracellular-binding protein n=1 Tax=Gryllus longicercus TaxID=2509291 RepID=A0AAN9VW23_9ORTH
MSKESTCPDVDVFISNYILVDPDVFQLWVDGYSSSDAVNVLNQRGVAAQMEATLDLLTSDVLDHFRTYSLLERLLHNPTKLSEQLAFQIDPQTRQFLIEKRQFDNIKRVFKAVEEMSGSIVQNIRTHFLLPEELARRYGAVVFLGCMRFETGKRKLQYLTFSDFHHCAQSIMVQWTYGESNPDYNETELDREFLLELRDVRILIDKDKEHKHLVCARLRPQLLERTLAELDTNFRSYSRALVSLACNMHRTRELRLLFIELVERCLEPWRLANWSLADLRNFLATYTQCALEMDVLREAEVKKAWERYMNVITVCALRMYHT